MTTWTDEAITRLTDSGTCPLCEQSALSSGWCPRCGADLRGEAGRTLWVASVTAADALRARAAARGAVPYVTGGQVTPAPPAAVTAGPMPPNSRRDPGRAASTSLQSVLATAGAGLFAVAAIVFTFFNPELADRGLRSVIIALITVAFLLGARVLARRGLQSSAEAVGGLGLVFVGLDVQAVAACFATDSSAWAAVAMATAAAGALLLFAGHRFRIRVWLWASVLALAAVPALFGFGIMQPVPAALLMVTSALAATALIAVLPRFSMAFSAGGARERSARPFAAEVAALTVLQVSVAALALARCLLADAPPLGFAAVLAALAVHGVVAAAQTLPRIWASIGGVTAASAGAMAMNVLPPSFHADTPWVHVCGAVLALLLCALVPLPARTSRLALTLGAGAAVLVHSIPFVLLTLMFGGTLWEPLLDGSRGGGAVSALGPFTAALPTLYAVLAVSAGCVTVALCARIRPALRPLRTVALTLGALYAVAAVLLFSALWILPLPAAIGVLLGAAAITAVLLIGRPDGPASVRGVLIVGIHLAVLVSVLLAWRVESAVPLAGLASIAVLLLASRVVPRPWRALHAALGYGYALALIAHTLALLGIGGVAQLSLTASAGLLGAIAATFIDGIRARTWQVILAVATVPVVLGVVQVIFERSGWTALSTGLMCALALTLLFTRRPGLTLLVRTLAAATLVPSLAVVVLCLGAQLLEQSGSPVVLPLIALLVAVSLSSSGLVRDALISRGRSDTAANIARTAIDVSALATGTIAAFLAVAREAAGLGTACLVFLIMGLGAVVTAVFARQRYAWWVAAVSMTGALWSLWALNGVDVPEAYLLPPAVGAAVIAVFLVGYGARAAALFTSGTALAILPILGLLIFTPDKQGTLLRAGGLVAASALLTLAAFLVRRAQRGPVRRMRVLGAPAATLAGCAALAGVVLAVRWGNGLTPAPTGDPAVIFLLCVAVSACSAAVLTCTALLLRRATRTPSGTQRPGARWFGLPAVLAIPAGAWGAIVEDWFVIGGMWVLMLGILLLMVWTAGRAGGTLPPVWVLFGIAFITAVVAWSPRELRVETFSLPLGMFLLLAGMRAARRGNDTEPAPTETNKWTLNTWPHGVSGSWPLYAPGLIVLLSASIVATFTDPLTWRAILVMVIALAAILIGAARRLAAPFLIGLIVLPIENVFVFSVQLGRGIESMPWWITLATMGAVLLIIAVAGERREGRGSVIRLRDLR